MPIVKENLSMIIFAYEGQEGEPDDDASRGPHHDQQGDLEEALYHSKGGGSSFRGKGICDQIGRRFHYRS